MARRNLDEDGSFVEWRVTMDMDIWVLEAAESIAGRVQFYAQQVLLRFASSFMLVCLRTSVQVELTVRPPY